MTPKASACAGPMEGRWLWDINGVRRVLYRLPELLEAVAQDRPIFFVEGEKAVGRTG